MSERTFYATTPRGMEALLARELVDIGVSNPSVGRAGVAFGGDLTIAYRACLWSRIANRILLNLGEFSSPDADSLYAAVRSIDWSEHMDCDTTFAVNAHCSNSSLTHSQYVALRTKDAIVDQFRESAGIRPSVEREFPDLRINAYVFRDKLRLSLDLSGGSLHRRGYRQSDSGAPLKENLAAAILQFSGWPEIAEKGGGLLDPMCGSGTFLVEAAMMAADIAPGLMRAHFGFLGWKQHNSKAWEQLVAEARQRREIGVKQLPDIRGSDNSLTAIQATRQNLTAAELDKYVNIEKSDVTDCVPGDFSTPGLLVVNPPYGERLGADGGLAQLYSLLGKTLRHAPGWYSAVFTGNPSLTHRFKMHPASTISLNNGDIDCKLFVYPPNDDASDPVVRASKPRAVNSGAEMFANRLSKNLKTLRGWAKSAGVQCYRVYDADLPEFALAIDLYPGCDRVTRVHVQEYAAPKTVDAASAARRLNDAVAALPRILACDPEQIFVKVRSRQRGALQYEKLDRKGEYYPVSEGAYRLLINLTDYHDCGLFLDHRKVRQKISKMAAGKRFLNLFAYTGAASVSAAIGGARQVTSVDMSNVYLDWAKKNFSENMLDVDEYEFIRADCLEWLDQVPGSEKFDVILLDPPTFSNSKRMSSTWDVQRDHAQVIKQAMARLNSDGVLLFSTNRTRFKLDPAVDELFHCREITKQTVPRDFARNPQIHRCWEIAFRA